MLNVVTMKEARSILSHVFCNWQLPEERVPLVQAAGRVLARPVEASEFIPDFDRSTVDGYALCSGDTFGCSESIPALLTCVDEVQMGEAPSFTIGPGQCAYIPTGGQLPHGADAVAMLEYAENYGGGLIGIQSPCAPGAHLIFRGDDISPGRELLPAGRKLAAKEIGALAAAGVAEVPVLARPKAAVFSSGDELIPSGLVPAPGQIRDVNGPMLTAALEEIGWTVARQNILRDEPEAFHAAIAQACSDCDAVFLSGGSSVGKKDNTHLVLSQMGCILFHGLAVKPGKPTLLAEVSGVPVLALPGHPAAAWFIFRLLAAPWLAEATKHALAEHTSVFTLTQRLPSNHGREEYVLVQLEGEQATPLWNKSGLITSLSRADGYLQVPRDTEGLPAGSKVTITIL